MIGFPSLTTIALITGDVEKLRADAETFVREFTYYMERAGEQEDAIIVVDGDAWNALLGAALQMMPKSRVIVREQACELPGVLVNAALTHVTADTINIVTLGTEISTWHFNKPALRSAMMHGAPMAAGYRSEKENRQSSDESHLVAQRDGFSSDYPHAWLQMLDLVPMSNAIIATKFVRELGGFSEATAMQRMWWWEFCLRASKHAPIKSIPRDPTPMQSWHRYPFTKGVGVSVDDGLRMLIRVDEERNRITPFRDDESRGALLPFAPGFAASNNTAWRTFDVRTKKSLTRFATSRGRPLRIAVLGGVNEPAHNQLCFFNYFALLGGANVLTWRSLLDTLATAEDIADCDLVIFSRVRNENGCRLMDACVEKSIPTIYMLDDNWFWLGREWAGYEELFTPGKPDYEHFLYCLQRATTTLTYNNFLADDLRPHAKKLALIPTNVNLAEFPRSHTRPTQRKRIGYVGSLRKNATAFQALQHIITTRDDVDLFVMSNAIPDEFLSLPQARIVFEPYQFNYAAYARTVCQAAPDVLVAPVGRTRFEASKCPNKFLEITAARAAGVYSHEEPYTSYVEDGKTGLLVADAAVAWIDAITNLLDDDAKRQQIVENAYAHVAANFDTRAVLPAFMQVLAQTMATSTMPT
jgi:glycosyltransferase involved in cell wall biosynthesis